MTKSNSTGVGFSGTGQEDLAQAEICLGTRDLARDLEFFTETLKFRLDAIYPADHPAVAVISGHGLRLRLERGAPQGPAVIRMRCADPAAFAGGEMELTAPGGTRIEIAALYDKASAPEIVSKFMVRKLTDTDSWIIGRAGMQYRDLVPGRLGGGMIASHIRIPDGGPVPDMVHYHKVRFQLIYCYRGWVKVVYEDQGPPFILNAGDCVTQPPEIRHRVLEASDNLEVIEIGVPADHLTLIDHDLELPNGAPDPDRLYSGQRFCHHVSSKALWKSGALAGFEISETGIGESSGGAAEVVVARRKSEDGSVEAPAHEAKIRFIFILKGAVTLRAEGRKLERVTQGDAFTVPPGLACFYEGCSGDLELLQITLM